MNTELSFIIKSYQLIPYHIKLRQPWHSAATTITFREGFVLRLQTENNLSASGECAPMTEIGTESLAQAQTYLQQVLPELFKQPLSISRLTQIKHLPACRFALETALLSLQAQQKNISIACLLNAEKCPNEHSKIKVNTMLGSINEDILCRAEQAEQQGFKCLKVKMGLRPIEDEVKILQQLLAQLSAATQLRLDANKSWHFKQVQWLLQVLACSTQQIDSIEEPLKVFDHEQYRTLQHSTAINLALDESFPRTDIKHLPVKQLVLKPMAQGGLLPCLKLAGRAQRAKINVVITSSIETAHGLWPISHLCAAIGGQQFHGLATAAWLEDTLIKPPGIKHGIITL